MANDHLTRMRHWSILPATAPCRRTPPRKSNDRCENPLRHCCFLYESAITSKASLQEPRPREPGSASSTRPLKADSFEERRAPTSATPCAFGSSTPTSSAASLISKGKVSQPSEEAQKKARVLSLASMSLS